MYTWEVLCKVPGDGRGEYSEAVTVKTRKASITAALKAAQEVLDRDYDPGVKAVRAELIPSGFIIY